ncbi:MAG: hypothetical protein HC844_05360, partial [Tabrizicola sp.]|nr:hypothetical protein [Tabrizicola sp.]
RRRNPPLAEGARACLAQARHHLDPDGIAAAVARQGGMRSKIAPDAAAWALYRARFLGTDPDQSGPPLDNTALARAIRASQTTSTDKEPSA